MTDDLSEVDTTEVSLAVAETLMSDNGMEVDEPGKAPLFALPVLDRIRTSD